MARNLGQRRQDVLVTELARGQPHTTAAKLSGFSLRTVQRRLDDPKFREEVRRTRDGLMTDATGQVAGLMQSASDVLSKLLASTDEGIRLSAVKTTFDVAVRLRTTADLENRLQALEGRINGQS